MSNESQDSNSTSERPEPTSAAPGAASPPKTPTWVKVFAILAAVVILVIVVVLFLTGGDEHGPGRHMPGGNNAPADYR